jgi:hypothetical protein
MESLRIKHNLELHDIDKSFLMKKSEINTIEERCNKIQSQKWRMCKVEVGNVVFYDVVTKGDYTRPFTKQECEFIINAQSDIPKLIQHIKSLQRLLQQYQQSMEKYNKS